MECTTNRGVWLEVRQRLMNEPYNMKAHGDHLRAGRCPNCGKKSLWTKHGHEPARVWCDRENNCGYTATAKELFYDLFDAKRILRDNPPTPENPNASADAWLKEIRGFTLSGMKGWYSQHSYDYRPQEAIDQNLPAERVEAIRFQLPSPMQGAWDRFMDGEHFGKKTYLHTGSKLNEWMWTPPGQALNRNDDLMITEGIFDALALREAGYKVAALMGATNKPIEFIKEHRALRLQYIVALDNDTAGRKQAAELYKWLKGQGESVDCIQTTPDTNQKIDWNDLLKLRKLTSTHFDDYRYYGQLFTAATATKRALLMYSRTGDRMFVFEHQNSTYVWDLDMEAYDKKSAEIRQSNNIESEELLPDDLKEEALNQCDAVKYLGNCALDFLYTQRNPITDELFYFFRIRHADGRETLNTFTGAQLAAAADFRKRLLSAASGALIKAEHSAHNWLMDRWMRNVKDVDTVGYAGYSAKHQAWIYPDFAIHKGKVLTKNQDDYIELSKSIRVKSAYHNVKIEMIQNFKPELWLGDFIAAWNEKGVIALAFFTLSLFSQQIRERDQSLGFLELVGDPGTGKSTLLEFLWRLLGREHFEGFDPSSSNPAAVARIMNQVSNLPVVMIEGDRMTRAGQHKGAFNWSEVKKLYNGNGMKARAMRTQGNETYEPPFLGALIISQNAPVDAEQAVLERIVHVFFHKKDTNAKTLAAVKRLVALNTTELSGYLIQCLINADKLLTLYDKAQTEYELRFRNMEGQHTYRLAKNHSQIAAAVLMVREVLNLDESTVQSTIAHIKTMSLEREKAISAEHPDVQHFFEVVDYLSADKGEPINHIRVEQGCALNLNEVYEYAAKHNQQLMPQVQLKPLLQHSRRFIEANRVVSSNQEGRRSVRCWIFRAT